MEDLKEISLDDYVPCQNTFISTQVDASIHKELALFLRNNRDIFAWSHEDIPGISPNTIVHKLNICLSFPLV